MYLIMRQIDFIDPTKSHDAAMDLLAEAGIYVIAVSSFVRSFVHPCLPNLMYRLIHEQNQCLSTPHRTIRSSAPNESYIAELLQSFFRAVDCLAAYTNTLGVVVANGVINSFPSVIAAPVVRAVTRDVKRYMVIAAELSGQRVLPVGVSSGHVIALTRLQFEYFSAGDEAEAIDFYSVRFLFASFVSHY